MTEKDIFDIINSSKYDGIGCKTRNFSEIGNLLGISRQRVKQIELSALKKIKKRNKDLKDYLNN